MKPKVTQETAAFLLALTQGSEELITFAEQILGVDLNRAQKRWFIAAAKGPNWLNKIIVHVAANQIGKTLGLAILILWACHYKVGLERPKNDIEGDYQRWFDTAYQWFHLAPTQQQAYLVLRDIRQLVDGTHAAQRRKSLFPQQLVTFLKVEDYEGLQMWNGSIVQFRTTDDRAKALQGRRAAAISYDEAAFEPHLTSVVNEVLLMRLIAFGGPLFLVSTPDGINDYYEIVMPIREQGELVADQTWVKDSSTLVWSTVHDNIGYGLTAEGVEQMEAALDESTRDQQLRGAFLEPSEAFFVPTSSMLAAFVEMPDVVGPEPGRAYVTFWDTAARTDPVVGVVLDVTTVPWRGVYFKRYLKPPPQDALLLEMRALHGLYNGAVSPDKARHSRALTGWDATGMGGVMLRQQLSDIRPSHALNFGGPKAKINMLTNLRAALSTHKLLLPKTWMRMQRELTGYRLDDTKIQQDCVMALAGAAELASRGFSGVQQRKFDPSGRVTRAWL